MLDDKPTAHRMSPDKEIDAEVAPLPADERLTDIPTPLSSHQPVAGISNPDWKQEYVEVGQNMRQFGNIRFAQLTVFIGLTAGVLTLLSQSAFTSTVLAETVLKVGAILVTALFWMMDERAMQYWHHFRRRGVWLESQLGFRQYMDAPTHSILSTTNAIRILYLCTILLWVTTLIFQAHF